MKTLAALFAAAALLACAPAFAQKYNVDLGADPALTVAGKDLAPADPRVMQARDWLKKVAAATGENEEQVAASCMKLARFLFDNLRLRALPAEALEGLAAQAAPGKPLADLTTGYYQARRASPNKTHAEAMAALKAPR